MRKKKQLFKLFLFCGSGPLSRIRSKVVRIRNTASEWCVCPGYHPCSPHMPSEWCVCPGYNPCSLTPGSRNTIKLPILNSLCYKKGMNMREECTIEGGGGHTRYSVVLVTCIASKKLNHDILKF